MKMQLDFDNKIVTIEDNVDLGEFVDNIKKMIPDWRNWKLETKTEIVWQQTYPYYPSPWWGTPTWPTITVDGTDSNSVQLDAQGDASSIHMAVKNVEEKYKA